MNLPFQVTKNITLLGSELFNYFQRSGLDEMILPAESSQAIADIITETEGQVSEMDVNNMVEAGKIPKYPIFTNPKEKNPDKLEYKPKMKVNEMGDEAEITIIPEDLDGTYDYIPSVKSMAVGAAQELIEGRQKAVDALTTNPNIIQMLAAEGVKPLIKDLLIDTYEDLGVKDADRYFTKIEPPMMPGAVPGQPPMPGQEGMPPGMPQQQVANAPPMM